MFPFVRFIACFLLALASVSDAIAQYETGYVWARTSDFQSGPLPGKADGNPNPDARGNPVWRYESFVDSEKEGWFKEAGELMVWCPVWDTGEGGWTPKMVGKTWMTAAVEESCLTLDGTKHACQLPVVRWKNPVTKPFYLEIDGTVSAQFIYANQRDFFPAKVTLRIVHLDHSTRQHKEIHATTIESKRKQKTENMNDVTVEPLLIKPNDQILIVAMSEQLQKPNPRLMIWLYDRLEFKLDSFTSEKSRRTKP